MPLRHALQAPGGSNQGVNHYILVEGAESQSNVQSSSRTWVSLPRRLRCPGLIFSLMCCLPGFLRITLPLPVILYRFAAACMRVKTTA